MNKNGDETHSTKILVFSDLRLLRYRCFKFQPRGQTSINLAVVTFLFLKSQSRVTYRWKAMDKCNQVLCPFMVGRCLGLYLVKIGGDIPSHYNIIGQHFWNFFLKITKSTKKLN